MHLNNHTSQQRDPRPRLLLFPASLRRHSHQRRLIDYLAMQMEGRCQIDILSAGDVTLPLFNQDLECVPEVSYAVQVLHDRFARADGIIVASPEYNGHVSPYLKNTVDWVSRLAHINPHFADHNPFRNKPLLLTSASTGWTGGVLGLQAARSIFSYLGSLVVPAQICLSHAEQALVEDRYEFDPFFADHIARTVEQFIALVLRTRISAGPTGLAMANTNTGVTPETVSW
jgi:chromate reductase